MWLKRKTRITTNRINVKLRRSILRKQPSGATQTAIVPPTQGKMSKLTTKRIRAMGRLCCRRRSKRMPESSRVSRRRYTRNSEATDNATRPVSQANQIGEKCRSNAVSGSLPSAESAVDQSGHSPSVASAPTVSRNVEAVIANVQNVASSVDRVNRS